MRASIRHAHTYAHTAVSATHDHCAVIVAEDITSRFLNVISLFNGTIPLIAIQMQALRIGENVEVLRGHLSRCLGQVAAIAGMPALSEGVIAEYQGPWQLEAYREPPALPLRGI
jgi:hypothetical protein